MIYKNGVLVTGEQDVSPTASPTFANLTATGQIASTLKDALVPAGDVLEIDWNDGNAAIVDLGSATGDVTLSFVNPVAGASYLLEFVQGATARSVILPASVIIPGGTAPNTLVITATEDAVDALTLFYDGANYVAQLGQAYA